MLSEAEFLADQAHVLEVAPVPGVLLDGLSVESEGIEAADFQLPVGQPALAEPGHHHRLQAGIDQAQLPHEHRRFRNELVHEFQRGVDTLRIARHRGRQDLREEVIAVVDQLESFVIFAELGHLRQDGLFFFQVTKPVLQAFLLMLHFPDVTPLQDEDDARPHQQDDQKDADPDAHCLLFTQQCRLDGFPLAVGNVQDRTVRQHQLALARIDVPDFFHFRAVGEAVVVDADETGSGQVLLDELEQPDAGEFAAVQQMDLRNVPFALDVEDVLALDPLDGVARLDEDGLFIQDSFFYKSIY